MYTEPCWGSAGAVASHRECRGVRGGHRQCCSPTLPPATLSHTAEARKAGRLAPLNAPAVTALKTTHPMFVFRTARDTQQAMKSEGTNEYIHQF